MVLCSHVPLIGYATALVDDATKGIAVRVLGALLLGHAAFVTVNVLLRRKNTTPERGSILSFFLLFAPFPD
jgi:signal peptidase